MKGFAVLLGVLLLQGAAGQPDSLINGLEDSVESGDKSEEFPKPGESYWVPYGDRTVAAMVFPVLPEDNPLTGATVQKTPVRPKDRRESSSGWGQSVPQRSDLGVVVSRNSLLKRNFRDYARLSKYSKDDAKNRDVLLEVVDNVVESVEKRTTKETPSVVVISLERVVQTPSSLEDSLVTTGSLVLSNNSSASLEIPLRLKSRKDIRRIFDAFSFDDISLRERKEATAFLKLLWGIHKDTFDDGTNALKRFHRRSLSLQRPVFGVSVEVTSADKRDDTEDKRQREETLQKEREFREEAWLWTTTVGIRTVSSAAVEEIGVGPLEGKTGWGWRKQSDFCEDLSNRTVTRVEDLEPDWRILEVLGEERREVDPREVLSPPLKLIPEPPAALPADPSSLSVVSEETVFADSNVTGVVLPVTARDEGEVLQGTIRVLKLTRPAIPIRGVFDSHGYFKAGLEGARRARELKHTAAPLQNFFQKDMLFAGELLNLLEEFEREESQESLMETPILVDFLEKRAITEPDHSERSVLDAEFNFGLPASSFEFQGAEEVADVWRETKRKTSDLKAPGSVDISKDSRIRRLLKLRRTFALKSFVATEERVQEAYVIRQFLICPTRTGNCTDCPLDPFTGYPMWAHFSGRGGRVGPSGRGGG